MLYGTSEEMDILIKNAPELKENVTLSSNLKNTCQKNTQATKEKWGQCCSLELLTLQWDKENGIP